MEGEAADKLQLVRLFSLFFRGAKEALRRETSVDAERAAREPWLSDRVSVALVYDLEDDHGSYQHGQEVLKDWRDCVPTRLEPGKAKLAVYAVTVRGWLRIHPPGLAAATRQKDIKAVEALLKAWGKKVRGSEPQVPWFVRVERCPADHPAAPGFRVVAATDLPARTAIGRYAGLLRTGSADDYGTTAYRFDLPEKFNQNHQRVLRNYADVADWTAAAAPGTDARPLKRADSGPVEATPAALTAMAADVAAGRFAPEAAVPLLQAAAEALRQDGPAGSIAGHYKVAKRGGAITKRK